MKICIYTKSFYPVIGGIENFVFLLAREIVKFKYKVTVVTDTKMEIKNRFRSSEASRQFSAGRWLVQNPRVGGRSQTRSGTRRKSLKGKGKTGETWREQQRRIKPNSLKKRRRKSLLIICCVNPHSSTSTITEFTNDGPQGRSGKSFFLTKSAETHRRRRQSNEPLQALLFCAGTDKLEFTRCEDDVAREFQERYPKRSGRFRSSRKRKIQSRTTIGKALKAENREIRFGTTKRLSLHVRERRHEEASNPTGGRGKNGRRSSNHEGGSLRSRSDKDIHTTSWRRNLKVNRHISDIKKVSGRYVRDASTRHEWEKKHS